LVIRSAPEKWLSPRFYVDTLMERAQSLGVYDALFCSDEGGKYKRSDSICNALKRLFRRMGVEGFTDHLFRHSANRTLIDAGLDEEEVSSKYYLGKAWASKIVRALPTDRVPLRALAREIIVKDGDDEEL
jgi:integrase